MDSTSGSFKGLASHTMQFHTKPPEPHITTYTVFHGSPSFEGTQRVPGYMAYATGRGASGSNSGFAAVSQKFMGADGKPLYKWGGPGTAGNSTLSSTGQRSVALSGTHSPYGRGVPYGGLKSAASPYGGTERFGDRDFSASTLGSTGLPPVPYKSYLTEYVDEYREPVEHLDTLHSLTVKFNTTGGSRVTKRSIRSDGEPGYETRVVAF